LDKRNNKTGNQINDLLIEDLDNSNNHHKIVIENLTQQYETELKELKELHDEEKLK